MSTTAKRVSALQRAEKSLTALGNGRVSGYISGNSIVRKLTGGYIALRGVVQTILRSTGRSVGKAKRRINVLIFWESFSPALILLAWSRNQLGRLIEAPKIHFLDACLQTTFTRLMPELVLTQRPRLAPILENSVYGELLKLLSIMPETGLLSHCRYKDRGEINFVLKSPLREIAGKQFTTGIALDEGKDALSFGDGLWAVPL